MVPKDMGRHGLKGRLITEYIDSKKNDTKLKGFSRKERSKVVIELRKGRWKEPSERMDFWKEVNNENKNFE